MHVRCINKEHSSGGIKSRAGIACVRAREPRKERREQRGGGGGGGEEQRKLRKGSGERLNEERKIG